MVKHFGCSIILGSFILSPVYADIDVLPINSVTEQHTILLTENTAEHRTDDSSSRGRVTQGVIGAEAEENRKLVPEESAAQQKEQGANSNIRWPDGMEDDVEPKPPLAE